MTLLDAPTYNAARSRTIRNSLITLAIAGVITAILLYVFWNWPEEHRVNQFFQAVESQDFPKAFGIWNNDANWQQHPDKYVQAGYPYGRFLVDWSRSSDYGVITSHKIVYATSSLGNSVLLAVELNGRKTPMALAVAKKDHTMSFSPFDLTPMKNSLGWTYWQVSYH